jgi:hypothetical protein
MFEVQFFFYAVVGKLFIYTLQKFPLLRDVKNKFIRELLDCDYCLGVWVFSILSWLFQFTLFREYIYCPFISELATGVIISFLVHLINIGWREKFGVIVVER